MSVCIFPGRFQPFHTGQLMVVQGMAKMCSKVIIAVCHHESTDDLFTKEQVREMITGALMHAEIMDAEIQFVSDCGDDESWAHSVVDLAHGEEVVIWSGREEIRNVFESAGYETKEIKHVPGHESEEIADLIIARNSEWRKKVPAGVVQVVDGAIETQ